MGLKKTLATTATAVVAAATGSGCYADASPEMPDTTPTTSETTPTTSKPTPKTLTSSDPLALYFAELACADGNTQVNFVLSEGELAEPTVEAVQEFPTSEIGKPGYVVTVRGSLPDLTGASGYVELVNWEIRRQQEGIEALPHSFDVSDETMKNLDLSGCTIIREDATPTKSPDKPTASPTTVRLESSPTSTVTSGMATS